MKIFLARAEPRRYPEKQTQRKELQLLGWWHVHAGVHPRFLGDLCRNLVSTVVFHYRTWIDTHNHRSWRSPRLGFSLLLDECAAATTTRRQAICARRSLDPICLAHLATAHSVVPTVPAVPESAYQNTHKIVLREKRETYAHPSKCHPRPPPMLCSAHTAMQSPLHDSYGSLGVSTRCMVRPMTKHGQQQPLKQSQSGAQPPFS